MTDARTSAVRVEDDVAQKVFRFPLWAAIMIALAAAVLLTLPRAAAVWSTGEFFDSDDAMRAVEMRDLLAGQHWFDMTATRVDPPAGLFMHWSRVVDAPLAVLDALFRIFLSPELAERTTRLVFPLACLAALLWLCAWNARILGGEALRIPAVWLAFLSAPMFVQFAPGRIDHHAPQIVLLMATFGLFHLGLDKPIAMVFAAAAMALSIAISLENIPFFAVLLTTLLALFVVDGAASPKQPGWFALGVIIFFPLCFAATVSPSRYGVSACDAFSAAHLRAALVGASGLAMLALAASRLGSCARRAFAATLAVAAVLASVAFTAPNCLGDPLGGLDPLLRDLWLSHVVEAKPLTAFADDAATLLSLTLPVFIGFAAALAAAWMRQGIERWRWAATAVAILVGLAVASWQIRVFSSVMPLTVAPSAWAAAALARRFAGSSSAVLRGALTAVLCLAMSSMGVALALTSERDEPPEPRRACLEARAFTPLASLPAANIVAPVDAGAHILAFTPHSVFAAPYHRDNHGNRIAIDAFLAAPPEARSILRKASAGLILWCASGKMGAELVERAPSGLAAALASGNVPEWLEKIPLEGTPFLVFALRPSP